MLFSTKAEYGVRLMVELGRRESERSKPGRAVSLSKIAESENLPYSYLEHLVARLRDSDLVISERGAHGGYRLARDPASITMLEIVQALEGPITPMDCFHTEPSGRVLCSHEENSEHACATKLLWTRVQGGITRTLTGMTLAELVEFSAGQNQGKVRAVAGAVA